VGPTGPINYSTKAADQYSRPYTAGATGAPNTLAMWDASGNLTQLSPYTEGQWINTGKRWTNGKLIWAYAFHTTAPTNNNIAGAVSGAIPNVDEVINLYGTLETSDLNEYPINMLNGSNQSNVYAWFAKSGSTPNTVMLGWNRGSLADANFSGRPVRIVMEATRTDA
jgi:hypothetical protein